MPHQSAWTQWTVRSAHDPSLIKPSPPFLRAPIDLLAWGRATHEHELLPETYIDSTPKCSDSKHKIRQIGVPGGRIAGPRRHSCTHRHFRNLPRYSCFRRNDAEGGFNVGEGEEPRINTNEYQSAGTNNGVFGHCGATPLFYRCPSVIPILLVQLRAASCSLCLRG